MTFSRTIRQALLLIFLSLLVLPGVSCSRTRRITATDLHRQLALARKECAREVEAARAQAASSGGQCGDFAAMTAELEALRVKKEALEERTTLLESERDSLRNEKSGIGEEYERLKKARERERTEIEDRLRKFVDLEKLAVDLTALGVRITLRDAILFPSGRAELRPQAAEILKEVAAALQSSNPREIRIVGHTDDQPIRSRDFRSNWELSTARAQAVLHALADQHGLPPAKMAVIGYGKNQPVADNGTPEGRARNRRVEIYLVPEKSLSPD